jgi:hypothetical protein
MSSSTLYTTDGKVRWFTNENVMSCGQDDSSELINIKKSSNTN